MVGHAGRATEERAAEAAVRRAVAAFFPRAATESQVTLAAGGLSGSPVAQVVLPGGEQWAAKMLPAGIPLERGCWQHALMQHLRAGGLGCVPRVASLADGSTFWRDGEGCCWEMVAWMPGTPQLRPTPAEAEAAVQTLAALHASASQFAPTPARLGPPPALLERCMQAQQLQASPWTRRLQPGTGPSLDAAGDQAVVPRGQITNSLQKAAERLAADGPPALAALAHLRVPTTLLCGVVRDLTAEHVLFRVAPDRPPQVSGVIDFHAARVDTPACDLARLLASWHAGLPPAERIQEAVAWYLAGWPAGASAAPPATTLARLVEVLAATGVVLGLDNWVRWLVEENRTFPDGKAVAARVTWHVAALEEALGRLAGLSPAFLA